MAYISQITLPNNSTYNLKDSRVDNLGTAAEKNFTTTISSEGTDLPTAGAVYTAIQNSTPTETDPVFSASAAAGITSSDITNWNAKVSDTKTWGDVVAPSSRSDTTDARYVPQFSATSSTSGTTATFAITRTEPFSCGVPKWDRSKYLYAATPSANDNSTKVATTAYVDTAISGISGLQHILDGSATGSIRTSGSKSEGSSYTIGNNAFAEGYFTEAKGIASHAEGYTTSAVGNYSHAQGGSTTASGSYAHAEGYSTQAGNYAHAQGESTTASGQYSHAQGQGTTAQRASQHVFGTYNILDTTGAGTSVKGNYVQIVGNGTSSTRSNARTLDWSGNETLAGKLTLGANATAAMDAVTYQQLQERTPVTLCTYSSSPQGDGTRTQFQIIHGLNTTNVFVSVNITDTNGTYIAPLTSVQASAEIGYRVKIISANKIKVTFTSAPGTGAAVVNVFAGISNYINADNVSY